MSPFLTKSGKLVLLCGAFFMVFGVLQSDPMILILGEGMLALIATAMLISVPSATMIDRRLVTMNVDDEEVGRGHLVGDVVELAVTVSNRSAITLNHFQAVPFSSTSLNTLTPPEVMVVPPGDSSGGQVSLQSGRSGRWMLHGFDVSVRDPMGLVEARDYLPTPKFLEFYPKSGRLMGRKRRHRSALSQVVGQHFDNNIGSGTELRQLRDYQAGDSLRDIAWKPSLRLQKLIARENEREVRSSTCVLLDISSSMRGGEWPGQKLDHGVHLTVELVNEVLKRRDRVGLLTFDEKLYGHIEPGAASRHFERILHHLVGLYSVVDEDLVELDSADTERLIADYLLVQERLDFRKGADPEEVSGVNLKLLHRWLRSVAAQNEAQFATGSLVEGVSRPELDPIRRFLQLRGVEVPYRVEARLGLKERGLVESIERMMNTVRTPQRVVVITDLCALMNIDHLIKTIRIARAKRHQFTFWHLFTPDFYTSREHDDRYEVVRELFTMSERQDRQKLVQRLRSEGVRVERTYPNPN